jgi:hypothetical protein
MIEFLIQNGNYLNKKTAKWVIEHSKNTNVINMINLARTSISVCNPNALSYILTYRPDVNLDVEPHDFYCQDIQEYLKDVKNRTHMVAYTAKKDTDLNKDIIRELGSYLKYSTKRRKNKKKMSRKKKPKKTPKK